MEPRSLVLAAVVGALWGPACVWAQGGQSGPPLPMPQTSVNRPAGVGSLLPDIDSSALPSRRVPSPAPLQAGEIHPVTPDTWRKPSPSAKPARSSKKSGGGNIANGEALSGKGSPGIKEPLQRISGTDGPTSTQRLNDATSSESIQRLPSAGGK